MCLTNHTAMKRKWKWRYSSTSPVLERGKRSASSSGLHRPHSQPRRYTELRAIRAARNVVVLSTTLSVLYCWAAWFSDWVPVPLPIIANCLA